MNMVKYIDKQNLVSTQLPSVLYRQFFLFQDIKFDKFQAYMAEIGHKTTL